MTFPLSRLLNQSCSYQPFLSSNNRDDPTYGPAQTVQCRIVEIDREHYAKDEDVRQSRTRAYLLVKPVLRSLLNGREIIHIEAMVAVDGQNPGWIAFLR